MLEIKLSIDEDLEMKTSTNYITTSLSFSRPNGSLKIGLTLLSSRQSYVSIYYKFKSSARWQIMRHFFSKKR